MTEAIVAAIAPTVTHASGSGCGRAASGCENMSAWENYQRGLWHVVSLQPRGHRRGAGALRCAIAADPQFAPAHAGYAYALYVEAIWGFVARRRAESGAGAGIGRAARSARPPGCLRAPDARPGADVARRRQGCARGVRPRRRAQPEPRGRPISGSRYALALAGRADDALASVDRAIRLSPYDPLMHAYLSLKSGLLILTGRFAEAIDAAREAQRQPNCSAWAHLHEASALANLGRLPEAKAAMNERMRCSRTSRSVGCARCCRSSRA